jgi:hypothetical protein
LPAGEGPRISRDIVDVGPAVDCGFTTSDTIAFCAVGPTGYYCSAPFCGAGPPVLILSSDGWRHGRGAEGESAREEFVARGGELEETVGLVATRGQADAVPAHV